MNHLNLKEFDCPFEVSWRAPVSSHTPNAAADGVRMYVTSLHMYMYMYPGYMHIHVHGL